MFNKKNFIFVKKLWFKITAITGTLVTFLTIIDYFWSWGLYSFILKSFNKQVAPVLLASQPLPVYAIIALIIPDAILIAIVLGKIFNRNKYFIPISSQFYTEHEPSEYDRRTKWNFKTYKNYYYVPLLSQGYNTLEFTDLCGPYCSNCDHVLRLDNVSGDLGRKFFCVNCRNTYKIPAELLGSYKEKIMEYFREEFRQHRVKQAP